MSKQSKEAVFNSASHKYSQGIFNLFGLPGGATRKGKENIVISLLRDALEEAIVISGLDRERISLEERLIVTIPFNNYDYLESISKEESDNILENVDKFYYRPEIDLAVSYDDNLILAIEAKSYTETTMLKKFVLESLILREAFPEIKFVLMQLENSLGGDYAENKEVHIGSPGAHAVMAPHNMPVKILTLLDGARSSIYPIHTLKGFKPLNKDKFYMAIDCLSKILVEQTNKINSRIQNF